MIVNKKIKNKNDCYFSENNRISFTIVLFGKVNTTFPDYETTQHLFKQIKYTFNTTVSNNKQYFTI